MAYELVVALFCGLLAAGAILFSRRLRRHQLTNALAELKDWKAKATLVFRSMGEGVFGIDTEGKVIFINEAAARMLGWKHSDIIGKHRDTFILKGEGARARMSGQFDVEVLDERFQRRDGTSFPVAYTCSPLMVDDQITGAVYVFRDDTLRQQQESELKRSNVFIRSILDHSPSIIYVKKTSGEYLIVNNRFLEIFGFKEDQVVGKKDCNLFPRRFFEAWNQIDTLVIESGKPMQLEEQAPLSDGIHTYISSKFPLIDTDGHIYAVAGISTDITDRAKQERRLEESLHQIEAVNAELVTARRKADEANQFKSVFLANMSHELRTPLNGVTGLASLLERSELNEKQKKYVKGISQSSQVLLALINDILDFSKIEAGEVHMEKTPVHLHQLVQEVGEMVGVAAAEKKLAFTIKVEEDTPHWVMADSLRLRQVLINITSNAIKFTEKGYVSVVIGRQSKKGDYHDIRFEVTDSGIGIAQDKQAGVFQKFYQADASTTRRFGGTGLGLAISKQLVELMGGKIGMFSTQGVGSTFWFEVPFETPAPVAQEIHNAPIGGQK